MVVSMLAIHFGSYRVRSCEFEEVNIAASNQPHTSVRDRLENDSLVAMLVVVVAAACSDAVLLALVAVAIDDFDTMTSKRKKKQNTNIVIKGFS